MQDMEVELPGVSNRTTRAILSGQIAVTLLAWVTLYLLADAEMAWSALVGGGIGLLSTAWFALRVFAGRGGENRVIVRRFYVAETQKIVLTVVLFIVAILVLEVRFLPMFGTYILSLLAFWFALLPALTGTNPKDLS